MKGFKDPMESGLDGAMQHERKRGRPRRIRATKRMFKPERQRMFGKGKRKKMGY
jgi:hypothetical protein